MEASHYQYSNQSQKELINSAPRSKSTLLRQNTVKVFCRIKPLQMDEVSAQIQVNQKEKGIIMTDTLKKASKTFMFNQIFDADQSQQYFVKAVCQPVLKDFQRLSKGSLIFSYGVTNSGKTHSILGTLQEPGILPYLIKHIPQPITICAIELYNQQFYSLKTRQKLIPRQLLGSYQFRDYQGQNINKQNMDQLLKLYMDNRSQNDTKLNSKSSRSHAIFKIQSNGVSIGVVDLAGSQRINKLQGGSLEETSSINKSLLCLGKCIQAFKDHSINSNIQIPYRQSKLTRALIQYFGPCYNVLMIANLNKSQSMFHQNLKVMQYAAIAKQIKPNNSKHYLSNLARQQSKQKIFPKLCQSVHKGQKKIENQHSKSVLKINSHWNSTFKEITNQQPSLSTLKKQIKILNEEIVRLSKKQQFSSYLDKLEATQSQFDFFCQYAFQKQKRQADQIIKRLKQQEYVSPSWKNRQKITNNVSVNTITTMVDINPEKLRQELKEQLKRQLVQIEKKQQKKFRQMVDQETTIGKSLQKINLKNQIVTPNKLYNSKKYSQNQIDRNQQGQNLFNYVVRQTGRLLKSSARKIYESSSTLLQIVTKSSKKNNKKQKNNFKICSYQFFSGIIQSNPQNRKQKDESQETGLESKKQSEESSKDSKAHGVLEILQATEDEQDNSDSDPKKQNKQTINIKPQIYQNLKKVNKKNSNSQKLLKLGLQKKAAQVMFTPIKNRLRRKR